MARDLPTAPAAQRWRSAVEAVRLSSPRYARSLAYGRLVALRPGEVALFFTADAAFHRATCTGSARTSIEKVLSAYFGQPTRLLEEALDAESRTVSLAEEELKDRSDRQRDIESRVRSHPAVRSALRILGGELEHVQVLEPERPAAAEPEPDEPP